MMFKQYLNINNMIRQLFNLNWNFQHLDYIRKNPMSIKEEDLCLSNKAYLPLLHPPQYYIPVGYFYLHYTPHSSGFQYNMFFYGYQHTFLLGFVFLLLFFLFLSFIVEIKPSAFIIKTFHSFIILFLTVLLILNVRSGICLWIEGNVGPIVLDEALQNWANWAIDDIFFSYGLFETFSYCFLIILTIFIMIFCLDPFFSRENDRIEFATMMLLIVFSGGLLLFSRDFIEMFVLLECISLASYVLVGFEKHRKMTATIAIQYLILSSIPAAFFVLGLAFLYKDWGTLKGLNLSDMTVVVGTGGRFMEFTEFHDYIDFDEADGSFFEKLFEDIWSSWFDYRPMAFEWYFSEEMVRAYADYKSILLNPDLWKFELLIEHTPDTIFKDEYPGMQGERVFNHFNTLQFSQVGEYRFASNFFRIESLYRFYENYVGRLHLSEWSFPIFYLKKFLSKNLVFPLLSFIGIGFLLINLFFKLTAAPFHVWAPTVYQNTPVTAVVFLTVIVKAIIFLFLLTLFTEIFYEFYEVWGTLFIFISIFSMIIGILGAFIEKSIKKFIVYSSISHAGFILLALPFVWISGGNDSYIEYLVVYSISSLILWGGLLISLPYTLTYLTTLRKILLNNLLLLILMSINLFSMGGIPPLAGFFIKFDIIYCVLQSSYFYLGFLVFLLTIISFFYYLRLIKIMFFENFNWMHINKYPRISKAFIVALLIHFIIFITLLVEYPLYFCVKEAINFWLEIITM